MDYWVSDCGLFAPPWYKATQTWWERCGLVNLDLFGRMNVNLL